MTPPPSDGIVNSSSAVNSPAPLPFEIPSFRDVQQVLVKEEKRNSLVLFLFFNAEPRRRLPNSLAYWLAAASQVCLVLVCCWNVVIAWPCPCDIVIACARRQCSLIPSTVLVAQPCARLVLANEAHHPLVFATRPQWHGRCRADRAHNCAAANEGRGHLALVLASPSPQRGRTRRPRSSPCGCRSRDPHRLERRSKHSPNRHCKY